LFDTGGGNSNTHGDGEEPARSGEVRGGRRRSKSVWDDEKRGSNDHIDRNSYGGSNDFDKKRGSVWDADRRGRSDGAANDLIVGEREGLDGIFGGNSEAISGAKREGRRGRLSDPTDSRSMDLNYGMSDLRPSGLGRDRDRDRDRRGKNQQAAMRPPLSPTEVSRSENRAAVRSPIEDRLCRGWECPDSDIACANSKHDEVTDGHRGVYGHGADGHRGVYGHGADGHRGVYGYGSHRGDSHHRGGGASNGGGSVHCRDERGRDGKDGEIASWQWTPGKGLDGGAKRGAGLAGKMDDDDDDAGPSLLQKRIVSRGV
jgi:hypothetical protein